MRHLELLARLAQPATTKIVLLILDGVGDLRSAAQPQTALDLATKPNLDGLARGGSLGRIVPVATGVTPGSGPGHLALFGYDPASPQADIGRGILEALGLGLTLKPGDVAARGNFATADSEGLLVDRRAGRIPSEECARVCASMNAALAGFAGAKVEVFAGEAHRFVALFSGAELSPAVADTDPQRLGVPPLAAHASSAGGEATASLVARAVATMERAIADEPKANRVLLRGFSQLPKLPQMGSLYQMRFGAFAAYPLYRGVASACGMEVNPCGKPIAEAFSAAAARWQEYDFFFIHAKKTDQAGEDGNLAAKVAAIEEVDAALPQLLALRPDVLAVTGDHSTPAPMKSHSWHPVPLLVSAATAYVDGATEFSESAATAGHLGTFPSRDLIGLLLAHAGRLAKFGA